MDWRTLQKAMWPFTPSDSRCQDLVAGANQAMEVGGINTVRRAAMFLAQVGWESGGLVYTEEIGQGHGHSYYPYCGRTFIQVTWDYNYRAFGQWLHGKGLLDDPNYFVNNPSTLANIKWAWLGPVWFWTTHGLNDFADRGDIDGATQRINGGYNGLAKRAQRWNNCLKLGNAILPEEDMTPEQTQAAIDHAIKPLKDYINKLHNAQRERLDVHKAEIEAGAKTNKLQETEINSLRARIAKLEKK